jgi:hypothetical protein
MFLEPVIGHWQVVSVPATPIAALVATYQEDRLAPAIEGE